MGRKFCMGLLFLMMLLFSKESVQAGQWQQDEQGYRYQEENGIWMQWQWKKIGHHWYYFDEWGHRVTGWKNIDGGWYSFDQEGRLQTNCWVDNTFVGADGRRLINTWVGRDWVNEEGEKDTSVVRAGENPLKAITLSKESVLLLAGETENLVVSFVPEDTTRWKRVVWTSSDPQVAQVSNGKISAEAAGTAQITARLGDVSAVCSVTVKESPVCQTALSLLDAQYIWGGDGPVEGGVDCSGLLMYAYTQNGYDFGADLNANNFSIYGQEISREELQPGDAICCVYNGERYQHILLYIGNDMVVASECGGPAVCTAGLSCEQHVMGTHCNCRTWKRPLNENDLVNAKFVRMDGYRQEKEER